MSSSTFTTIQSGLDLYGTAICMVLGYFGNAFIIILFHRQRQNACGLFLLSAAVVNILYLTLNGFIQIFPYDYSNATADSYIFCKLYFYIRSVVGQVTKTMVVAACIDRYLITSERAVFRAFSTPTRAKWVIFFSVVVWLVLCVHLPVMYTIAGGRCGTTGIYSTLFTIFAILFVGVGPCIILGVFGYLAYHNMRQMQLRVQPAVRNVGDQQQSFRRKDRDLLIIVIAEVVVYVITISPFALIFLEMVISQYAIPKKSIQYMQIEFFILGIAYFLLFLDSTTPFYIYLAVSKSFRRDSKQLFMNTYWKIRGQLLGIPTTSRAGGTTS